jgi:probable HAF family extracellular repeat protein
MKSKNPALFVAVTSLCMLSAPVWLAAQPPEQQKSSHVRYTIKDLGTLGGPFSEATAVTDNGLITGTATLSSGTEHATLWYKGLKLDLGTIGLEGKASSGLNSGGFTVNDLAQVVGNSEVSAHEKDSENFCGYGTGLKCLPFLWEGGVMTALPTLGGKNGWAVSINQRGQATGVAEEGTLDTHCVAPQALDFEAAVWGPSQREIKKLRPLPGDTVGIGLWINDKGQVVGQSGSCGNTVLPPIATGPHAVLWENGSVIDLGNLGGACLQGCRSAALGPFGNTPLYINNRDQVVGTSALAGEQTFHAFLWTREKAMKDLGTVPGDYASVALSVNDEGEIVGLSMDKAGVPRAFIRLNGVMTDLNTLLPANSPIYALVAEIINARGEIAGFGVTGSGQTHAFLATPSPK